MNLEEDLKHILNHTETIWPELSGKTIFLTGGTGFFGKWLLESFLYANTILKLNSKLVILSRKPESFLIKYPKFKNPALIFLPGDITDFNFPTEEIHYIIHAATDADTTLHTLEPIATFTSIVEGTTRVLELAKQQNVEGMLYVSSGAVYGKQPFEIKNISEDFTGSPDIYDKNVAYAEGKRVSEMLCSLYNKNDGINVKIARCFAFVGPYQPLEGHYAIGNFIKDILTGNKIVINGDGTPYRSYLYAADLTVWLWNILVFGKACRPYNVGSDEEISIKDLAYLIAKISGKKNILIDVKQLPSLSHPLRYVPSVQRAKEELKLNRYIALEHAIEKTIKANLIN